jgi:hypothetical protein
MSSVLFDDNDYRVVVKMFQSNKTTKEVQDYLSEKYKIKRSKTSNFIKRVRKKLGIYNYK